MFMDADVRGMKTEISSIRNEGFKEIAGKYVRNIMDALKNIKELYRVAYGGYDGSD